MQAYESVDEALYDVLRLSRGMTLKSAVAGLPLGGGKCVIIADPNSSNNQLERPDHGKQLFDRNIVYVPDFVVNAGGEMGASTLIFTKPNREKALADIKEIFTTVTKILERSRDEGRPSADIAEEMAVARICSSA